MYNQRKTAKRFTLLLLEEEEDYVQDWVATCKWPSNVSGCWSGGVALEGRVRLCTRSLFFDPDDVRVPIVRLPFASTQSLEAGAGGSFTQTVTSLTKMKANMEEVPYVFEKGQPSTWQLTLLYAPLASVLPLAQQLLAANKQGNPKRTQALEAFVRVREDNVAFDTSRLADFSERILLDMPAVQLTPLVHEHGHLVITDTRLYFQPMYNVSGDVPVRSHPLAGVAAFARRRSCLRPLGLELFFVRPSDASAAQHSHRQGGSLGSRGGLSDMESLCGGQVWDAPSAFFAFRTEAEREAVAAQLSSCPSLGAAVARLSSSQPTPGGFTSLVQAHSLLLEAQGGWLHKVTAAWQAARVSNFDYLMYLNLAAGRSFNDLAQWPVFPWVLSNWVTSHLDLNDPANFRDLTKPVGALNPARLKDFQKRYLDMPTDLMEEGALPPFMYGTHYSTPGYVMYWLLRAAPAHMLRLQNGRFDAPDRLFHGLQESWESVNNSTTDVKELIPEFYLPGGSWLVNALRLPLGVRQSGQPVADVELPPWAHDPEHFLAVHRAALEAPPVSRALHHWIDLIFGYKQTGPAAEAADNVFFHLTYEGAVDVSKVTDPVELKAFETQINEFGQTPKQLFHQPHPPRRVIPPAPDPATVFCTLVTESASQGAVSSAVSSTGSSSTAGGGVMGSEMCHRALAMTIISALGQAAAVPVEERPPPPAPPTAATAPADPAAAAAPPASGGGPASGPSQGAGSGPQHSAASTASDGSVGAGTPHTVAGAVGGLLSGLLKLGRYQSAAAAAPQGPTHTQSAGVLSVASTGSFASEADNGFSKSHSVMPPTHTLSTFLSEQPNGNAPPAAMAREALVDRATEAAATGGAQPEAGGTAAGDGTSVVAGGTSAVGGSASAYSGISSFPGTASDGEGLTALRHVPEPRPAHTTADPSVCPSAPSRWSVRLPERLWACSQQGQGTHVAPGSSHSVTLSMSRDPIAGVASWRGSTAEQGDSSGYVCSVSSGGLLKVTHIAWPTDTTHHTSHTTLRSQQLEGDLLCLASLHGTSHTPHVPSSAADHVTHPLILTGSHNQRVYAYDVAMGQLLGSFQAHDDAVCALALPALPVTHHPADPTLDHVTLKPPGRFFTSSWDCTIKVWSLAEGRQPWTWAVSSLAPSPEVAMDLGEGVWALAAGQDGSHLVIAGTEEGRVVACDLRTGQPVWTAAVAQDYVGGVALSPCGHYVSCGTADGALALLDVRNGGARLALASSDAPVRCCASDGWLLLAGGEGGAVQMWDVGLGEVATSTHMGAGGGLGRGGSGSGPSGRVAAHNSSGQWGVAGSSTDRGTRLSPEHDLEDPSALPGVDGLFKPWFPGGTGQAGGAPGVSCLHVRPWFDSRQQACVQVAAGREDGSVAVALCT